ncbi:DNA topoisomerase VI subunit B [Methanolobus bombayensis]|uniref:DNA topoisomerase VI subunit B n=1 Tax=Methanolobus bombayensis TaxID=38023 RepID=UPI001AEAAD0E|nr:DNA topoisomerase VI subunit B [Methanolobus bombayensis]MBP1910119.1 DNA topoisomerase-6 subunit B [Methanolobus bombayensis]
MKQNEIAEELAKEQKAISVAEFFEKNRHILGFDSKPRCLNTTIKEGVDNSLDACEDAGILPEISIMVKKSSKYNVIITIEDNGPGITKEQIPKVFAILLYGSKFHHLKQSRGQQGIGISAAVLYSQLSSGASTKIISKTGPGKPAHYFELMINTNTNEPEILKHEEIDWYRPHGTGIEMEMKASYVSGRKQSVYEYLKASAIVNPHARISLTEPSGETVVFERATEILPIPAKEVLPHPHGIEIGTLMKMAKSTCRQKILTFLIDSFAKIGRLAAEEICEKADVNPELDPHIIDRDQTNRLLDAFSKVKLMSAPTYCLSPIGQDLMKEGLKKEFNVDHIATTTRPPQVHSGNTFLIEVGIGYGGDLKNDDTISVMRFANKVPLLYQQGGCLITEAIKSVNWTYYGISHRIGYLPTGPLVILVHVASTNIPFTSESKDAIADIPEIRAEIQRAIKEVAKKVADHKKTLDKIKTKNEKKIIVSKILPRIAKNVSQMVDKEVPNITPVVARVMENLLFERVVELKENGFANISINISNFSHKKQQFSIHDVVPFEILNADPEPLVKDIGLEYDYTWDISVSAGSSKVISYFVETLDEVEIESLPEIIVEGLDESFFNGAIAIHG